MKKKADSVELTIRAVIIPAETALFSPFIFFAVRSFIISRDTVMGIPEAEIVISTPTRDSAI